MYKVFFATNQLQPAKRVHIWNTGKSFDPQQLQLTFAFNLCPVRILTGPFSYRTGMTYNNGQIPSGRKLGKHAVAV